MKNARTIRTLGRVGIRPESIGFAGHIPNGKAVRRLAKWQRAERRLLAALPTSIVRTFWAEGITTAQSVRAGTYYLRAPRSVQEGWLEAARLPAY